MGVDETSECPLGVDEPPASGSPRALDLALSIIDRGPGPFYRAAMASLALTAVLTMAIALIIRPHGTLPASQRALIAGGLAALGLICALRLALLRWPPGRRAALLDRLVPPAERAAIWLALAVWFPALLVAAYFKARATLPPSVHWILFGYLDKRWETSAYLIGALAPMVLLVAAARILTVGRGHPQSWRSWLKELAPASDTAKLASHGFHWRRFALVAIGILTAVALAYYFYGPPWYLDRNTGAISYQEDVFLAGLQAMSKRNIPFIGPASVQYGPGTQLLSYLYMRHIGTFSVVGFREAWALFQWAGASIFFVAFFLALGYARGLVTALLSALIYPTLQLLGFQPGQMYNGFFGWANPLRYAGAFTLIILLPAVIRRCPSRGGLAAAGALGFVWGTLSYVAQENLIAGAVGALVVGALLFLSNTASGRTVRAALLAVLAGFLIIWLPMLAYYADKGVLGRFLSLYFRITQAVAEGYSNIPFKNGWHGQWASIFYILPFALAVLALLAVIQFRPFRIATKWSRDRILLVAALITTIVLYQGALLRSDPDHLAGTMLAVPALVVTVATTLPRLVGAQRRATLSLGAAALVAGSFLLLPYKAVKWSAVQARLEAPYLDRQQLAREPEPAPAQPVTTAGERVGAGLVAGQSCCQWSPSSMLAFIKLMDRVHAIIGNRVTYVVGFPNGYPGIVYFVADLKPAPIPFDPYTMVFNEPQKRAFLATFRKSVLPRIQALVTSSLEAPETRYFLHRYTHARRVTLIYAARSYYVILSSD